MRKVATILVFTMAMLAISYFAFASSVPQVMNYQGYLTSLSGAPVAGPVDIVFTLYSSPAGTAVLWTETESAVPLVNGVYFVTLGSVAPLNLPFDQQYWLGVKVGIDPEMTPRQALTSVPFAFRATAADTVSSSSQMVSSVPTGTAPLVVSSTTLVPNLNAEMVGGKRAVDLWQTSGNAGTTAGTNFIGTTDNQQLDVRVNNVVSFRIQPTASVMLSGQTYGRSPNIIGGYDQNNVAAGVLGATIGGGGGAVGLTTLPNNVFDLFGTVAGGLGNSAGSNDATVDNAPYATVGGGNYNTASNGWATVGGGANNTASNNWATVAGGADNTASGVQSTVGGGSSNAASVAYATVSGGYVNTASGVDSAVGGGAFNTASGVNAAVSGGAVNTASGMNATVGGGRSNTASGYGGFIGGGYSNTASGSNSFVAGGQANVAGGDYSLAAGFRAKVRDAAQTTDANGDEGTFVWADSQNVDFASTGPNQFLVRASGGVGINTTTPGAALDVNGSAKITGTLLANPVGIGTSSPLRPLHIAHTGAAEMNFEVSDAQANWKIWNLIAGGSPVGGQQNFTFRILTDDGNSVTKDVFVLGYTGNATLAGTLTQNSDIRLKTDIQPLDGSLDKVLRLRGVSYRMKDDVTNTRRIGVIAQEIELEYPELVLTDEKGIKSVAYANLTPVLIEAIKELKAENETLKARLDAIESRLAH